MGSLPRPVLGRPNQRPKLQRGGAPPYLLQPPLQLLQRLAQPQPPLPVLQRGPVQLVHKALQRLQAAARRRLCSKAAQQRVHSAAGAGACAQLFLLQRLLQRLHWRGQGLGLRSRACHAFLARIVSTALLCA